jgi:hypothetical protein
MTNNLTAACVKISKTLHYTIEQVLDHDVDWIEHIYTELLRQEWEEVLFQMALHGVPKDKLDQLRKEINQDPKKTPENVKIPLAEFRSLGLSFGKENKTKVIRGSK